MPTSAAEDDHAEDHGEYPCVAIVRLFESPEVKDEVEALSEATGCSLPVLGAGGAAVAAWAGVGHAAGFSSAVACWTHDGVPTSGLEHDEAEESGEYPCMHVMRLYGSKGIAGAVEGNHPASVWRQ